jgi:hypothetical protein
MTTSITEFATRARAQGSVWSLKAGDDTWIMHEDPEDFAEAMPVWLDAASARACAVGDWAGFVATELSLADFVDGFLGALDEEGAWVGLNFGPDEQGELVDPVELAGLLRG